MNCGVCEYGFDCSDPLGCQPQLVRYNFAAPLFEDNAPITSEPDAMVAAR